MAAYEGISPTLGREIVFDAFGQMDVNKLELDDTGWGKLFARLAQLKRELDGEGYRTAASLGKALSLSEKTVRNLIKEINAAKAAK